MSLINEALRKARQEAAQHDGAQNGRFPPPGTHMNGTGARFGAGLVLGAVIAVAAALVGAGLVWMVLQGVRDDRQARQEAPDSGPTATGVEAGKQGGHSSDEQWPAVEDRTGAGSPTQPTAIRSTSPMPDPGTSETMDPAAARADGRSGVRGEPSPFDGVSPAADQSAPRHVDVSPTDSEQRRDAGNGGRREFFAEADLGYAVLTLDYIVFRETDPFAQINGQGAHVGTVIEGFEVVEVARDHVSLRDHRGPLTLKIR